jgi:glyoxylase-like metal-dependent hydrolase (beta-lactamase superfamily II)
VLSPGTTLRLGRFDWEVHAAPGHDANSIILFQPDHQVLIAADALWEKGFGVVFQELDGESAFDEVAQTLRLIERLAPQIIIPGHGRVFGDLKAALMTARARLAGFVKDPRKHAIHGAKVMLKFKLLEWQSAPLHDFLAWATATTIINAAYSKALPDCGMQVWLEQLINDLIRVGAATLHGQTIANAN